MYKVQSDNKLYFLHEHPSTASSRKNPKIFELLERPSVKRIVSHMCAFGMMQEKDGIEMLVKKPTAFMTNSDEMAKRLSRKCEGEHRHVVLIGGRAKRAEIYPEELCREILIGLVNQMKIDGRISKGAIGMLGAIDENEVEFWDDVSGKKLRTQGVIEARKLEISEFKKHNVYRKVPLTECWEGTGKGPLDIRWIDINKGDNVNEDLRSRLVAKEI